MLPKNLVSVAATSSKVSLLKLAASALLCFALAIAAPTRAQTADAVRPVTGVASRLTSPIVEASRVTLQGAVHPLANKANDRGLIPDGTKLERMQIVLKRSDEQESSLKRLVNDLHSPGSASYHKWLTPEQFGKQFGPSDDDLAKLETWLQAKGFTVTKLAPGRQVLEVAGTANQLKSTFNTEMHQYSIQGVTRYANANSPEIPAALAPVFGGFVSLNNFPLKQHAKLLGKAQFNSVTHESKAEWTRGSSTNFRLPLAPGDFAVQYDLNPLYAAGVKGDGQTIAIVNESNINVALVNNYRSLFGLPANTPQVIIDGSDPGVDGINSPYGPNSASIEAYLDVEVAGSVAPNAQIDLVIANDTAVDNGLTLAMEHAVYSNVAPVISLSFGGCEANQGSFNTFISGLWEQAAAQGQTVMVSTGDQGSAGCDGNTEFAVFGQAVNGLASTPYNVAVGGTDFYYSGGESSLSTYWNTTVSNTTPTVSLKSVVPEQPWNDSQYGQNLISVYDNDGVTTIAAGSGGPSTAGLATGSGSNVTYGPYPKPSWQSGVGVPADGARDLPDVSLFAADGINLTYYPICSDDGDCQPVSSGQTVQITGVGGTSGATPAFAGMMALVNQKYGPQGQANYILYPLAAQYPTTFHDVTGGTNTVPCATTTVFDAYNNNLPIAPVDCKSVSGGITLSSSNADPEFGITTEGEISVDGTNASYNAGTGYDYATGLGTLDANNLVTNWGKITLASTTTTLTPSMTSFVHGTAINVSGTVTGSSTPTGDVALVTTSPVPNTQAAFPLSSGAFTGSASNLPGGSYDISGYYAGNSTNGPSSSTPVPLTVTPESSATVLTVLTAQGAVASGGTVQYGEPTILHAAPGSTDSTKTTTAPTGSVAFLDGSATVNTAVVTANGYAEYNGAFGIGAHTVKAQYSGDASYGASNSASTNFTVIQNTPVIYISESNADASGNPVNGQVTYIQMEVENSLSFSGLALPPTGTLSILSGAPSGTTPTSATLVSGVDPFTHSPQGTAYFAVPSSALNTYNITFSYSGDTNYKAVTQTTSVIFDIGAGSVATTTTANVSAAATSPTSQILVSTTVTSSNSAAPTGYVVLFASGKQLTYTLLATGSGNSSSATLGVNSALLPQGVNQVSVQYIPLTTSNFQSSAAVVQITNPLSDFTMVPLSTILSVPATGTGAGFQTDVINLSSVNGFADAVSLSCTGASGVLCSLSPTSATLSSAGSATTTLLVDTGSITVPGSYEVVVTGKNTAGTIIHTLGLTAVTTQTASIPRFTLTATGVTIAAPGGSANSTVTVTPANGFTGTVALTCTISGVTGAPTTSVNPTCAATSVNVTGTSTVTTTITINTDASTTSGSYTAVVNGASGSLEAIAPFSLVVGTPAAPSFTLAGTAVTIASQGATGTSNITVTPANAFTGTVALTCSVTSSPSGALTADNPTCSAASASVTAASAATATLTINTTAQTAKLDLPSFKLNGKGVFTAGGGVALGAILLFGVPFGRRRKQQIKSLRALRMLSLAVLFALAAGAAIGCGSGGSSSTPPPSGGTTTGTYTLTVTGTSGSTTANTMITVTVN
ncbi:hypothetical protein HDF16_001849 [Granulicella aggregans]|uniref:Peptidase S53 domain-containing protein n=1 Tax=Granulicella aggregans TaxID=474949 RepID=A0A7W7ZCQ5_9BACT|nr:protease pro-enzyme activation domain-containing protein [Granulicella aggregans]MBB5057164.1 hypothetical protein [Granulicella aggregans]